MDGEAIIEFAFNSLSRLCTLQSILSACVLRILQKIDGVRLQRPEIFPLSKKKDGGKYLQGHITILGNL